MGISKLDKEVHIAELSNLIESCYFSLGTKLSDKDKRDIMIEVAQMYQRKFMLHSLQKSPCKLVTKRM